MRVTRALRLTGVILWLLAGLFVGLWILLVTLHLDDAFRLDRASGSQLALVDWLLSGVLYPELFDGSRLGGTFYFPVPIVVNAVLAAPIGDVFVAGKIINALSVVVLSGLVMYSARRLAGLGILGSITLGLVVPMSDLGLWMATTVRWDAIGSVIGLAALITLVADRGKGRSGWWSGILGALAVFARPTAVWSPLALLHKTRGTRNLKRVVISGAVTSIALLLAVLVASEGRFFDVVALIISGEMTVTNLVLAPFRMAVAARNWIAFALVLTPLLLLGGTDPKARVFRIAFIYSSVITLFVFTEPGAVFNHLLDLLVLGVVLAGFGAKKLQERFGDEGRVVVALTLVAIAVFGVMRVVDTLDIRTGGLWTDYPLYPVASLVPPGTTTLFEDPRLAVARGEHPVVLDPVMVSRIPGQVGDDARSWLTAAVSDGSFDRLVLNFPLGSTGQPFEDEDFSVEFWKAAKSNYCHIGSVDGFHVYEPCR